MRSVFLAAIVIEKTALTTWLGRFDDRYRRRNYIRAIDTLIPLRRVAKLSFLMLV